jgi:hypothetical protein
MQFLSQTLNDRNPNYIFVTVNTKDIPHLSLFLSLKNKDNLTFTQKYSLKQRKIIQLNISFDSSDMIYLLLPDRFANGNTQTIMMPPPENTIVIYRAEDMAVT